MTQVDDVEIPGIRKALERIADILEAYLKPLIPEKSEESHEVASPATDEPDGTYEKKEEIEEEKKND